MVQRAGVEEIDRGWEAMKRKLIEADGLTVEIGVFDTSQRFDTPASNVQIAGWMEFGTRTKDERTHVPARPFLSTTLDDHAEEIFVKASELEAAVLDGRMTNDVALNNMGDFVAKLVKQTIDRGHPSWPPLAAETIRRKGSSRPLIDTRSLYEAVTFRIVEST